MDPLNQLTVILENQNLSRQAQLESICRTIQQLIPNANMVSLWQFESDGTRIRSLINFDANNNSYSSDIILQQQDYPPYFEAITQEELVVAADARNHSVTRCFNESYFKPLGIYSLLDFILHKDFKPTGVICCERKGDIAHWTAEDIDHIRMVSSLISFCFDLGQETPDLSTPHEIDNL